MIHLLLKYLRWLAKGEATDKVLQSHGVPVLLCAIIMSPIYWRYHYETAYSVCLISGMFYVLISVMTVDIWLPMMLGFFEKGKGKK